MGVLEIFHPSTPSTYTNREHMSDESKGTAKRQWNGIEAKMGQSKNKDFMRVDTTDCQYYVNLTELAYCVPNCIGFKGGDFVRAYNYDDFFDSCAFAKAFNAYVKTQIADQ